jgi:hypothetical protein
MSYIEEEDKIDRTVMLLVSRLNAGEVIPDEDLVGVTLKYPDETYADNISDLLVASAGKPGQGILTRIGIDPNLFKNDPISLYLDLHYKLFPVKGKFNFKHAVTSLLVLMRSLQSSQLANSLNGKIFLIFLGFWLYHGEGMYGGEFYAQCTNELRVMNVNQTLKCMYPMFWSATQEQWDLFMKFKFLTVEVRSDPTELVDYSTTSTFAPLYIVKQTIKLLPEPKIEGYNHILSTWEEADVAEMYPDGGGEAQPKGSIKEFFDATNTLVTWSGHNHNSDAMQGIRATFVHLKNALRKEKDFNPGSLKWLSETYFVKSLSPNSVPLGTNFTEFGVKGVNGLFLVAITPGIIEKVAKGVYKDLLESEQKKNRELIMGTAKALSGMAPYIISRIIMGSLPWERVFIGVGGKREHGKMGDLVHRYIGGVLDTIEKINAEKEEQADAAKRARTTASSDDSMYEKEFIGKLKKVFAIDIKY